jgi:hypothetical protein
VKGEQEEQSKSARLLEANARTVADLRPQAADKRTSERQGEIDRAVARGPRAINFCGVLRR